jgi:hypothetical protein
MDAPDVTRRARLKVKGSPRGGPFGVRRPYSGSPDAADALVGRTGVCRAHELTSRRFPPLRGRILLAPLPPTGLPLSRKRLA